jgi:stage II sporulation protein D
VSFTKIQFTCVAILFSCVATADQVRVKLLRLPLPLEISGENLTVGVSAPSAFQKVSIPKKEVMIIDKKKVGDTENVWIVKMNSEVKRYSNSFIEVRSSSGTIQIMGYQFPSPLLLSTKQTRSSVDVIASLNFDSYLEDVLMSEMPSQWPIEALKAQAVATRSYALYQMRLRQDEAFQLDADNSDQVFAFHHESLQKERVRQALDETENKILTIHGRVAKAFFHSDCGGKTEDSKDVWGLEGASTSLGTAVDSHCPLNRGGRWTVELKQNEIEKKLVESLQTSQSSLLLKVKSRTSSGRVAAVTVAFTGESGAGGENYTLSGNEVRRMFGFNKIKSTLFNIEKTKNGYRFSGQGFGHGSGLCQWGAKYLADNGSNYLSILRHYYPKAAIVNAGEVLHVAHR